MTTKVLRNRTITDETFPHLVRLLGPCIAWAESIEDGKINVDRNTRNMIQIPCEIALAFVRMAEHIAPELGDACRDTLKLLEAFRAVDEERGEPEPQQHGLEL